MCHFSSAPVAWKQPKARPNWMSWPFFRKSLCPKLLAACGPQFADPSRTITLWIFDWWAYTVAGWLWKWNKQVQWVASGNPCTRKWLVTSLLFSAEMWYGVFLWALVSSLFFHVPAGLLALFTLRHHKYGRFMSVSILLMGIVGPITAGILTSMLDVQIPVKTFHMTSHLISGPTWETCLSEFKRKIEWLLTMGLFFGVLFFSDL